MPQAPMRPHRRRGDYVEIGPGSAQETASPSWSNAVEAFLTDARSRHCSPTTVDNYRTYLLGARAGQFLQDSEIRTVSDITAAHLRGFQAELLQETSNDGGGTDFQRLQVGSRESVVHSHLRAGV